MAENKGTRENLNIKIPNNLLPNMSEEHVQDSNKCPEVGSAMKVQSHHDDTQRDTNHTHSQTAVPAADTQALQQY